MNFVVLFLRLTDTVHLDVAKLVSPFLFRPQNHTSKQHQKDQETELKTDTVSIGIADCGVWLFAPGNRFVANDLATFLVQGAFTVVVPSTTSSMALVEFRRSWGVAMANGKAGLWSTKPPWVVSLSNAGKRAYDALFSLWISPNENGLMSLISIWTCTCLKNTFGSRDKTHAFSNLNWETDAASFC